MKVADFIPMCWRLVLRNRRRYKVVIFAIALGTMGFIIIRTMGDSVEKNIGQNLELLGEATVMKADWDNNEDNYHPGQYYMKDVARLKRIPHVTAVAPVVSLAKVPAYFRSTEWQPGLAGIDQNYWKTQTPHVISGRLISASDVVGRRQVCVLGKDVVKYLFGRVDPVGQVIRVGNLSFQVIGILGGIQHTSIRSAVFIPITTAQSLFKGLYWIKDIYVRVNDWNSVEQVRKQVLQTLKTGHKGYEQGIRIIYFPERVERVRTLVRIIKFFVYAALIVTFVLGKVGLTNVMLAAVQDRTREIGLRKALGAREGIIRLQFLTESVMISFLACIIGVVVGLISVQLLKGPLGVEISSYIMSVSILIDFGFTLSIGVWAGMYPSARASRLDVVTAMRFE